jgi:multicomponent K+:H+ antiporter subunit G
VTGVPFWVETAVAVLLVSSGIFVVISAIGFLRLPDFFLRMHPPALAYTFGSWCVTLAGCLYFSAIESRVVLYPWLVSILLCMTVPVTTLLLARVALFRRRAAGSASTPPPLTPPRGLGAGSKHGFTMPDFGAGAREEP